MTIPVIDPQNPVVTEPVVEPSVNHTHVEPVTPPAVEPKAVTADDILAFLQTADESLLLKVPNVTKLVQNARQQEKEKLYKTIENKEGLVKELEGKLEIMKLDLESKSSSTLTEQEKLMQQIELLTGTVTKLQADIETERVNASKEKAQAQFEAYKERRLREVHDAGTPYLADLLGGSTEEEFEVALDKAIQRYAELQEEFETKVKATPRIPSTTKVTNPAGSQVKALNMSDIRNMSTEEWAKIRELALKEAKAGN